MVSHETMKFCKFSFSSSHCVKWQFLHFHTILVVFYKVFIIITDVFGLFFAVVNPLFRNREILFYCFYTMATLKNHYKLNVLKA